MLGSVTHFFDSIGFGIEKFGIKKVLDSVSEIFGIEICPGFGIEKRIIYKLSVWNMVLWNLASILVSVSISIFVIIPDSILKFFVKVKDLSFEKTLVKYVKNGQNC